MTRSASNYADQLIGLLQHVQCTTSKSTEFNDAMSDVVDRLLALRARKKKAILVGNGGSASIVGHLQMDLCNGVGVRALCFHDYPLLTALANDHGYPAAFQRCVELWAEPGDLLIGVSSSGRSDSILCAVDAARACGADVVTLSGFAVDNPLRQRGDVNLYVSSSEYGLVETVHACLAHMLSDMAIDRGGARK
jgi:D-sedoheptulose 7-phosphate isomerase